MKIQFLGAAGTVTGSKYVISSGETKVLVDCGLFQGIKAIRKRNWMSLPVDPKSIDAAVLTHAHIDHSGFLPAFVREGFRGPVYCTPPTKDLVEILLPDSARIQEEEAEYANRKGFSRHRPAQPLYTEKDARRALSHLKPIPYGETVKVDSMEIYLAGAGHILGASSACVRDDETSLFFSGDIGRPDDPLMYAPDPVAEPDYVFMESTYGGRHHEDVDPEGAIAAVLKRTVERGGVLLIPSFAVGRAQLMLHTLYEIFQRGDAPEAEIYMNSPMATDVTELYVRHAKYHRLTQQECIRMCRTANFVNSVKESKGLNRKRGPMIIISASGMLTGGRVLHHIREFGPGEKNTILLPGYQARGTRGGRLVSGEKKLKIHGKYVPIRAEVIQMDMFSAHADQDELLDWLESISHKPKGVFLIHGDPEASDALRIHIQDRHDIPVQIPELLESVTLQG